MSKKQQFPSEWIERRIFLIHGQKVMLDSDLSELYGVPTKRLNEQVRRNIKRFPPDFMFQLIIDEAKLLRSQFATSSLHHGGRRYLPYVFTEQGIAMLSSVLSSERAIQVNIAIMRVFVQLRQMLAAHRELAQKMAELEHKFEGHDHQIRSIFDAIRQMMVPSPKSSRRRIGFRVDEVK